MLRKRKGFMIRTLDIRCNAAHPELPLDTFQSFVNSPSAVRVLNVQGINAMHKALTPFQMGFVRRGRLVVAVRPIEP